MMRLTSAAAPAVSEMSDSVKVLGAGDSITSAISCLLYKLKVDDD
jgi:hypothetical protein